MNSPNFKASLKSIASYVPKQILNNKDLEKMVDTSDEWIMRRTGIKERRIAESDENTSDSCHNSYHIIEKSIPFKRNFHLSPPLADGNGFDPADG